MEEEGEPHHHKRSKEGYKDISIKREIEEDEIRTCDVRDINHIRTTDLQKRYPVLQSALAKPASKDMGSIEMAILPQIEFRASMRQEKSYSVILPPNKTQWELESRISLNPPSPQRTKHIYDNYPEERTVTPTSLIPPMPKLMRINSRVDRMSTADPIAGSTSPINCTQPINCISPARSIKETIPPNNFRIETIFAVNSTRECTYPIFSSAMCSPIMSSSANLMSTSIEKEDQESIPEHISHVTHRTENSPPIKNIKENVSPIDTIPKFIQPMLEPTIRIVEQPKENGLRFRYECEGRSAGSLQGVNSSHSYKTFPCIEILNHHGPAMVVVSCVNATGPPMVHPHNLVGRDCRKGVCAINIDNNSMSFTFQNLGIQCVKRKNVKLSLSQRQLIRVDPFKKGFHHKNDPHGIDLNAVKLCFQGFYGASGKFTRKMEPVLSTPIYDAKAKKDLQIIEISDDNSCVEGGRKIIILCEKVSRDDVQVNFFEEDEEGNRTWEALGDFYQNDVHKQYGICFKTPRYRSRTITSKICVNLELRKLSNKTETSDPVPFYYTPSMNFNPTPSPSPPYFPLLNMPNLDSEEDVPTILLHSRMTTASEDDVSRAVYSMQQGTRHEENRKRSRF